MTDRIKSAFRVLDEVSDLTQFNVDDDKIEVTLNISAAKNALKKEISAAVLTRALESMINTTQIGIELHSENNEWVIDVGFDQGLSSIFVPLDRALSQAIMDCDDEFSVDALKGFSDLLTTALVHCNDKLGYLISQKDGGHP